VAGGFAHAFWRKGYHFDVSLHFSGGLDPGGTTHGILESLGILSGLKTVRSEHIFRADFPELSVALPNSNEAIADHLAGLFPAERAGLLRLFALLREIKADVIGPLMDPTFHSAPRERPSAKYANSTFAELLDGHLSDPRLKALLAQMWTYIGLPPSRSAANFSTCVFSTVWLEGSYQIVGGGAALTRTMVARLRELGGECQVKTAVDRILVEDGGVKGVRSAAGDVYEAPVVVSSASPHQTFTRLLPDEAVSDVGRYRLEMMESSLSMYSMYMGLDCPPSKLGIGRGNHFMNHGYDPDDAYRRILAGELERTDWCLTCNEGIDDALYPPGCGIVSTVELAPAAEWFELGEEEYTRRKGAVCERLLDKYEARFPGLRAHLAVCELGTPRTLSRLMMSHKGAVYGLAQTVEQSDTRRLQYRGPLRGLYLTGAWTGAGGGYEGAMITGVQAAAAVMREEGLAYRAETIRLHPESAGGAGGKGGEPGATTIPYAIDRETEDTHYRHRLPVRVYGDDLNSRGYADASSYLRYLDRGRSEAIERICGDSGGPSWLDLYHITVYRVDARCATVAGLAAELEVRSGVRRVSTHRASFDQRVVNRATGDLVVDALVEVLFLDKQRRLVPVPDDLLECDCVLPDFVSDRPEPVPFSDDNHFPFRTQFRVYFEDTDLQGITYHVSYARFCERALFDMIRTIWPDMGTATWMKRNKSNVSRLDVRYINSTTLGDRLDVLTGLLGMGQHKIVFGQRILLAGTTQVVVDATTEVEFRDERERLVPIPRQIVDIGMATLYPKGSSPQRGGKR